MIGMSSRRRVGVHIDGKVGCTGSIIEEGECTVSMECGCNFVNVGDFAGDIGGCGEGSDAKSGCAMAVLRQLEETLQLGKVHVVGVFVFGYHDYLASRFSPWQ